MEYYGSCLTQIERKFYLKIIDAFHSRSLFVKAEGITDNKSFLKCISAVQYDYPDLFYVDFVHLTYVLIKMDGNIVRSICMEKKKFQENKTR